MPLHKLSPVPDARPGVFENGIRHPDLWLWDAWNLRRGNELDLFCLALAREDDNGVATDASVRNDYAFHVRRFTSNDGGQTWTDRGAFASPSASLDGSDSRNIWSGSVLELSDGRVVHGYTGIRNVDRNHPFVQSANLRIESQAREVTPLSDVALICCDRDYDAIREAGYYLGPKVSLGHKDGEEGGPILCWRDPFLFQDIDGAIYTFLAAKTAPTVPAIAQILLQDVDGELVLDRILPPMQLPDRDLFTQAEVPKVYHDQVGGNYYLLISTTNRMSETQPNSEVTKEHRLYIANCIFGPWRPFSKDGSLLKGLEGLFGASLLEADFEAGQFTFIGPFSEMVDRHQQLSFSPPVTLALSINNSVQTDAAIV